MPAAPDPHAVPFPLRVPAPHRMPAPRELLARLVAFPTVSSETNLPLLDWVQGVLEGCGARCRRTWNDAGTRANLLATFGAGLEGGLILSGHTDVVPAGEPGWASDPFVLSERGGRLYGRGAADMKGFLAAMLAVAPELGRLSSALPRPVHLAFSYDEEVGCLGAPRMIDDLLAAGFRPSVAVVGEPTGMHLTLAHKSVNLFRTRVTGVEAHSSQPHLGAGAILAAGRLIEVIWRLGDEARRRSGGDAPGPDLGSAGTPDHLPRPNFEPPWTTVQVGTIEGGTAANILPARCAFTWEYRSLPAEDPDALLEAFLAETRTRVLPALREFAPGADIETTTLARVPPLEPEPQGPAAALVREVLEESSGAGPVEAGVVAYGTEGGQFQRAGISTVICGPGSIDQAHRPNEYLEQAQLDASVDFLRRLVRRWAGPGHGAGSRGRQVAGLLVLLALWVGTGPAAAQEGPGAVPSPPFCGVTSLPDGAPDADLHCVELLPRFEFQGAAGWGEMRPAPSPFGVPVDADGVLRWVVEVRATGLPAPERVAPGASALVAWATGPNLVPEIRLGQLTEGRAARGEVALDKFRILVTAEADPAAPERTGPIVLRGDSPSMRMLPHDDPWLYTTPDPSGHPHAHGGAAHGDHGHAGHGAPAPAAATEGGELAWRMPPMHPKVPMPPGLAHLVPAVTPWLPGVGLDDEALARIPVNRPTRTLRLADGDSISLVAGPVRRTVRGREHVLFGYDGQIPGPRIVAEQGSTIRVRTRNELPFPTAVHWHGLRLDNRFDGVPGVTQDPIGPGADFLYRLDLPDAGLFWYHPHLREDATQGLGLYGNLQVLPAGAGGDVAPGSEAPPSFHREVTWILDDLLIHEDGSLVPFGLEAPTHALMGRFGNVLLVNGEERPVVEVERGEVVRFLLTNAAAARPFHLVLGGAGGPVPTKLVATDLSAFEREAWIDGVVIAPAERYLVEARFDTPGLLPVENRVRAVDPFYGSIFPDVDTVAFVRVREGAAPPLQPGAPAFEALRVDSGVAAEIEALRPHFERPPDHELVLAMEVGELPFPLIPMMQLDSAFFQPVEWVSTMPEMNWPLTPREVRWILRDGITGLENGHIDWRFRQGDLVRLRVRNEREVLHAMQHPVHIHGQRFLVLSLNGVPQTNLAWKDTFLLPVGWTAELLVEMSNPGDWMIHCHISEHLEAGMQTVFRVEPAEGPPFQGWRGFEPGRGAGHHGGGG